MAYYLFPFLLPLSAYCILTLTLPCAMDEKIEEKGERARRGRTSISPNPRVESALLFTSKPPTLLRPSNHASIRRPLAVFFFNLCSAKQLEALLYSAELTQLYLHVPMVFVFFDEQ